MTTIAVEHDYQELQNLYRQALALALQAGRLHTRLCMTVDYEDQPDELWRRINRVAAKSYRRYCRRSEHAQSYISLMTKAIGTRSEQPPSAV